MPAPNVSQHREVWLTKPALRVVYEDYYRRIASACTPGRVLELGGGPGNFKEFFPQVVSTDITCAPWLDAVADAQSLPFADKSFDNIVLFDVLHHIENPCLFFSEAVRILRPEGRLILLEPAITPLSWFFYTLFHPEPVRLNQNPLAYITPEINRDPFDSNQAIPTLLLGRYRRDFEAEFPALQVADVQLLSLFAYPLSGGFRSWSLLSARALQLLLQLEDVVLPLLGRAMAVRLLAVIQRRYGDESR